MSGNTQDNSMEANSVDVDLIWADNPELEYFRSMMAKHSKNKLESELDIEDSLIGDSTVREMLEIEAENGSYSRHRNYPFQRQGVIDTSGLSDAESNTVDNIVIGDESIIAMKKTLDQVVDDGTIETFENKDTIPLKYRVDVEQGVSQQSSKQHKGIILNPHQSDSLQKHFLPPQLNVAGNQYNNYKVEMKISDEPKNIPGIIFVTEGHPSVVRTCPDQNSGNLGVFEGKGQIENGKATCLRKRIAFSLMLVVVMIIASTAVGILVYQIKYGKSVSASSSPSRQNKDSAVSTPNAPPTSTPSRFRANSEPDVIMPTPNYAPQKDEMQRKSHEPSLVRNIELPKVATQSPVDLPRESPSASPSKVIFFSPDEEDLKEPTTSPTPQSLFLPEIITTTNPTIKPTTSLTSSATQDFPTSTPTVKPTSMPARSPSEAPTQRLTDSPTTSSTIFSSEASSIYSTCASTIQTDKTCYNNGDDIQIYFINCEPKSSDWIGIYPTRQGINNLHQPSGWLWTCGDQLCSDPVAHGEATLLGASGFGSFRAFLLRSNDNNGSGYSAYAIGNRFTISSRC